VEHLEGIARRLREIAPKLDAQNQALAVRFERGCLAALAANEPLEFG